MRFKKTIFLSLIILTTFLVYLFVNDKSINYVALGDSLASGQNPYGEVTGYGYTDYVKDYLMKNNRLKEYIKEYANSGYKTNDILEDIERNKEVLSNNKKVNIRSVLRESDLVTISIGANDFIENIDLRSLNLNNVNNYKNNIDDIMTNIDTLFNEIRKYAKKEIVVIGYYNPFWILNLSNESNLDNIFIYADESYKKVCDKYNMKYISVYNLFKDNRDFLPNPFDIHPNIQGYEAISKLIIEECF